ncbi:MAG TPA: ABC transporter ATP-binding protein [Thermotogota bacterium]|nr:ABC transporter ATP-binding protein [Thermotogota bacterium]
MADRFILELEQVSKHFPVRSFRRFGQVVHAMDDVSFRLKEGEVLALVGESGSGKTTTASIIARLYPQTSGKFVFEGKEIDPGRSGKRNLAYRKKVQMIFQDPFSSLNPTHTIFQILSRPYVIHGDAAGKKGLRSRVQVLLESVGLEPPAQFIDKFPHELSGGQRQRVNIARTFSVEPLVILADEPTSMLDVSIRMSIMNMMLEYRETRNVSTVYITHDLAGARYMSDRIAVMYAGMIMEIGPTEHVIGQAFHPYTKLLRSAAPAPEKGLKRQKLVTHGDIPSLIDPPSGCRFHPRCPFKMEECSKRIPDWKEVDAGHFARCFL